MKQRPFFFVLLLLLVLAAGCGSEAAEQVRPLPFTDITTDVQIWRVEVCNLVYTEDAATLRGSVKNISPFPEAGLTMYVRFLDEAGELLVTGSCMTVLDEAAAPQESAGFAVSVLHFFEYDRIASVTIEFGH